ncbi:hypothetical protein [Solitalea lacus]|uniref:hypothetical protein n=1 Tax=Solitalea lacus TaxID=2911172 RepID=UPI001EDA34D3|nr:hypothetical protein [Solitalea lacus]UKJ09337.1 hypothetical protein L2B55_09290 [Solitalea lacus]
MEQLVSHMRTKHWLNIFIIYSRYLIGGAFVFASFVKIKGERFYGSDGTHNPVNSMPHFFETLYQSGIYWQFLGWSQLIAGMILMTQRFATLGALLFYPIILNIFLITISYNFKGTPFITCLMLLANTLLIIWDLHKFKPLLNNQNRVETFTHPVEKNNIWMFLGIILFITTVAFRLIYNNMMGWFVLCCFEGLMGFTIYYSKNIKRNLL